jgi:hypothetical protein
MWAANRDSGQGCCGTSAVKSACNLKETILAKRTVTWTALATLAVDVMASLTGTTTTSIGIWLNLEDIHAESARVWTESV